MKKQIGGMPGMMPKTDEGAKTTKKVDDEDDDLPKGRDKRSKTSYNKVIILFWNIKILFFRVL